MATYLPIKMNRPRGHRRSNTPARSKSTGKFLKGHRTASKSKSRPKSRSTTSVSRKRHLAGLKAARTRKRHEASKRSHRTKARGRRRSNLPMGFRFTKLAKHSGRPGGRFQGGWPGVSKWTGPKRRSKAGKRRSNTGKIRYRTKTMVVHKTKRLRNPVGFDGGDSLKHLGTWGKIGLAILFGLGGLAVAFGVPKGIAMVTGKDSFQRGWGGVGTSAVASLAVGGLVYLVSKRTGLGLLAAAGVGVAILAINALSPKAAQYVIPLNEATLAAMLPTFATTTEADQLSMRAASMGLTVQQLQAMSATGIADYQPAGFHGQRGPKDFYPATPHTRSATSGDDASFYGSPLAPKERF